MKLVLTREADADIEEILFKGAMQFGLQVADQYKRELNRTLDFLRLYPEASRERLEFSPPVRIHPFKAHVIIYRVSDDTVEIIRIRHGREDWAND